MKMKLLEFLLLSNLSNTLNAPSLPFSLLNNLNQTQPNQYANQDLEGG